MLIEAEILKHNNEKQTNDKAAVKARKIEQLEEEKKLLDQARQEAERKAASLRKDESVKSLLRSNAGSDSLRDLYSSNIALGSADEP